MRIKYGDRTLFSWGEDRDQGSKRYALDQYIELLNQFNYNNTIYPFGQSGGQLVGAAKTKEISQNFPAYMGVLRRSPPGFAAQMVRALVLSQARFTFRYKTSTSTPRKQFGTPALQPLEDPWTNATTGELISRMEWSAGPAGNAFVTNWEAGRLNVLRPDWTAIIHGSRLEPDNPMGALDRQVVGYVYQNGGISGSNSNPVRTLRPEEVAHWSPIPDPMSPGLGMSWMTPALRDIQGDNLQIEHKIKYFEQGATANLVMTGVPGATPDAFLKWVSTFKGEHDGLRNAWKTMYLTLGMDAKVLGANLDQLDFANTGAFSETRISFLSRVPAALLGISASLKGSSLNAGNYAETRRTFSDTWVYPTLQDLCAALAPLIQVPPYAELWFDTADIPLLREDAQIASQIEDIKATTIVKYMNIGFTPESSVAAVRGQDISLLKHDQRFISVQLQALANAKQAGNGGNPESPQLVANTSSNGSPAKPALRSLNGDGESSMQLPMNFTINVPERQVIIQPPDVIVQPAEVNVPITVQAAPPPEVSVPVTVNPPQVTVTPPNVTVHPPTVNFHAPPASKGVKVKRDAKGNVTEVEPK